MRAGLAGLVLLVVVASVVATLTWGPADVRSGVPWSDARETDTSSASASKPPEPRRALAPAVLPPAVHADEQAVPDPTAVAATMRRVERLLDAPGLGNDVGAFVVDAGTGRVLLDRNAAQARTPASLAKLAVGAAALLALGPDKRLETRAVSGATQHEVVLVGGGDATLRVSRARAGSYPPRASLAELAAATAIKLKARGTRKISVRVDDTLFVGPEVSPSWERSYIRSGVVAPVSALMADQARRRGTAAREADPGLGAGRHFARLLSQSGLDLEGAVSRASAPEGAEPLAVVTSAPVVTLVESLLTSSDNDLAESLGRHVARSLGLPPSFAGLSEAVPRVLAVAGLDTSTMRVLDGSGLARGSALSPEFAVRLLAAALADTRLRPLLTGLAVAGYSGTLAERFDSGTTAEGAGFVRAKTGTLSGVAALAGVAITRSGSTVAFAVLADEVPPARALQARALLDRIANLLRASG